MSNSEGREFTPIGLRLIQEIVQHSMIDLEKTWQAVLRSMIAHTRSEAILSSPWSSP